MLNTVACLPEDFFVKKSATTGQIPSEITVNTSLLRHFLEKKKNKLFFY